MKTDHITSHLFANAHHCRFRNYGSNDMEKPVMSSTIQYFRVIERDGGLRYMI